MIRRRPTTLAPDTVRPIIASADLERLRTSYTEQLDAEVIHRHPDDGPAFYVEVPDVDALLPQVPGFGGESTSGADDMPWRQRVAHIRDPGGHVFNPAQPLRPATPAHFVTVTFRPHRDRGIPSRRAG